jgi:hypothetical protein
LSTLTFDHVAGTLERCGERFAVVPLAAEARLIVTRYGGRILGPFFGPQGVCPLWLSPAFSGHAELSRLLSDRGWNIGGDRIWIAPELQYNVRDRTRFHETYELQRALDPGRYRLERVEGPGCALSQSMELLAYDRGDRVKRLHVRRRIRPADDPLRSLAAYGRIRDRLRYGGYEHEVTLLDRAPDDLASQTWNITQVPPGGVVLVPTVPTLEYADHLKPADADHLSRETHHLRAKILGDCMFKIELKAAHHFGRSGYCRSLPHGEAVLMVRLFFNNPSEPYVMEAPRLPGVRGYSLDVYHDDGGLGGFGELEGHGRPIGGGTGRTSSTDLFVTWFYQGEEEAVKEAALHLLGIEL